MYIVDMGLAKRYMKDGNFSILLRKTHPLQGWEIAYRNCPLCIDFYPHGYLTIPPWWYLIDRLRADVFFEGNSSLAKHEGIHNETKVQNDHGEKAIDAFGLFVQGLSALNADFYHLCEKLKIRVVPRLWLLERDSGRSKEKTRNWVWLQVWLEQVIFL